MKFQCAQDVELVGVCNMFGLLFFIFMIFILCIRQSICHDFGGLFLW
ncbi:hypothetical protein OH687_19900 [Burkholderia anthina]|nr:hypothetical protein OH687_19900 [Burkholderia anthina]